ncbi:YfcE family phosphodiesterase [Oenococcus sp.]|uniref:YfcE family phosphodiesterase n=1 Tax=Oenococcus sp. TaxID=1979414 RepID=UPI0039E96819
MNYLIFSDSHGDRDTFQSILDYGRQDPQLAAVFYNGDSEFDASDPVWQGIHAVLGNMDYDSRYPVEQVYKNPQDHLTIYQTHGHLQRVAYGLTALNRDAEKVHAEIVLFGHTHIPFAQMHDNKLFINPGSTSFPRGPQRKIGGTFAILKVNPAFFQLDFYTRDFQKITAWARRFSR